MPVFSIKQLNYIVLGTTLVLGFFIVYALREWVNAILGAVILYTIFRPAFLYFVYQKNLNKLLCTLLIIIVSFLIILLPFFSLSWMVIDRIIEFRKDPRVIEGIIKKADAFLFKEFRLESFADAALKNIENWAISTFPSAFSSAFHVFISVSITYFLLYFMFMYHNRFESNLIKYLPFTRGNSERLARELKNITYSNVLGQAIIAVTQGSLLGLGFWMFDLNDPLFWGVICTLLSFLPIIGSPLVFIPAGIIAITSGNSFGGIGIIIWGVVLVTNIDNLMRLFINKKLADTHPIITIMGVLIGLPFFGILGLVFGPLLFSSFILMIKMYETSEHTVKK